jgi:Tfp pilus assembly protein PilO
MAVIVIGAIWAGMTLTQQARQQEELKRNILLVQQKTAQIKIDDLTSKHNQLIMDKAQYTAQIIETEAKLSAFFDDISATDAILDSAHSYNLTIFELTSSGEANSSMAGNKFIVLPLNYHVKGNLANIAGFVSNIKTLFPTSVVQLYDFKIGGNAPAESPEIILEPTYTDATIKIIIYDYEG